MGLPSSSRLTLSRDVVDSRCEVRRGDLGLLVSCSLWFVSPFVSVRGTTGTGGGSEVLFALLFAEDDRRFVKDLVEMTGDGA